MVEFSNKHVKLVISESDPHSSHSIAKFVKRDQIVSILVQHFYQLNYVLLK